MAIEDLDVSAPEHVGLCASRLDRLRSFLQREVDAQRIPGAVVLVARRNRIACSWSCGFRNAATDAPMTTDALFRIYSMTKPLTSAAALMLYEEGRLRLEDPVAQYLPELGGMQVG